MKELLQRIRTCNDAETLAEIVRVAQGRLDWLSQAREVQLVCRDGAWFAVVEEDGKRKGIQLGERMTAAAVLRRSQKRPPHPLDYEIPREEADRRRQSERQNIGWVEDDDGGPRRFYAVPEFDAARKAWHHWKDLAGDPLAMAFGISVAGMEKLQKLREAGYQIRPPAE